MFRLCDLCSHSNRCDMLFLCRVIILIRGRVTFFVDVLEINVIEGLLLFCLFRLVSRIRSIYRFL